MVLTNGTQITMSAIKTSHYPALPGGLYVITDSSLLPGERLLSAVEQAIHAGAALIQYRDKTSNSGRRLDEAQRLNQLCRSLRCPLIINDDVDLALAVEAAGVHLGQADGSVLAARQRMGSQAIIGVTCHNSLDLACQAAAEGASYLAFGRFFSSATKPQAPPAELSILRKARDLTNLPVVAIGGINLDNAPQVLNAGANYLAVIHGVFGQPDCRSAAEAYVALMAANTAHNEPAAIGAVGGHPRHQTQ